LRVGDDLLAKTQALAGGRGVGAAAPAAARETAGRRPHRLLPGRGRFLLDPRRGRGGGETGPNPTDRRKVGSKHHLLTDAEGVPLSVLLTQANRNDVTQLLPLLDAIPPIAGKPGHPRRKPDLVQADRGYDSDPHRQALTRRGIATEIARRYTGHGSGLGQTRWVVERTIAWLHQFRRLRIRYERRAEIHEAFLMLGCALICWRFVQAE
jgi:transposase